MQIQMKLCMEGRKQQEENVEHINVIGNESVEENNFRVIV